MRLKNIARSSFLVLVVVSLIGAGACKKDVKIPESPDIISFKVSGKKMVGEDLTLTFSYDTKDKRGGTATIEMLDSLSHMHDLHKIALKRQRGKASWIVKPTFPGEHQFWLTVNNAEDNVVERERIDIADNPSTDPGVKRAVVTKFSGFYNLEYLNVVDWPEYVNWSGNVLIITYNDNTVRLLAKRDERKPVREGVIEGDKLIFKDTARDTLHTVSYYDNLQLLGSFESPPGKRRADMSFARN